MASVYERVRSIVAERLGVDEEKVTMEAEFIGDLNADSLDLVEVIMAMAMGPAFVREEKAKATMCGFRGLRPGITRPPACP